VFPVSIHGKKARSAGYLALIERYDLLVVSNWHASFVAGRGTHRIELVDGITYETYISRYWPGDGLGDHLEFALKYDGTNLAILSAIFEVVEVAELTSYVRSKPTGKYARKLWYLFELLTGLRLPLDDLDRGSYVELLPSEKYYTAASVRKIGRQRIDDNLLGDALFCPTVRRTRRLLEFEEMDLPQRSRDLVDRYPSELVRRALSYLYTKETRSSFALEDVEPDGGRTQRFVSLLQLAERQDFMNEPHLVEVQNRAVDPRFSERNYRRSQNYVGESIARHQEKIHYVPPKPDDINELMAGLIRTHEWLGNCGLDPVIHAAVVAYGFVLLHPFEDGNGRVHRFLIHNILARRSYTPTGFVFPVSAVMLKNPSAYDESLEAFSKPLMSLVDYRLDEQGRMTVDGSTVSHYRYIDFTLQAESLFNFIEQTIDGELVNQLTFLANYDQVKSAIQDIVDMPDRHIDLFVRCCLQNSGRLSARKRESHFPLLTTREVEAMELAVQSVYQGAEF